MIEVPRHPTSGGRSLGVRTTVARGTWGLFCCLVFLGATSPLSSSSATDVPETGASATGTVATDDGLHTATFDTLYGSVVVNLPDDLSAGDSISGTVETKPAGKKDEEVAKNQDELNGLVVEIGDSPTPASNETARVKVPDNAPAQIPVVVRTRGGREVARAMIPVKPKATLPACLPADGQQPGSPPSPPPAAPLGPLSHVAPPAETDSNRGSNPCPVEVPTFTQPGHTVEVRGPFDGESGTTTVNLGGQATKVLAESPRKAVVRTPPDFSGAGEIQVFKRGTILAKAPIRSIRVKLWAAKLKLGPGETTKLTATASGLDGLDVPVSLRVENRSPTVVAMEGGNLQSFSIQPGQVSKGQYVIERVLTGIHAGGFKIAALVDAKRRAVPSAEPRQPPLSSLAAVLPPPSTGRPVEPSQPQPQGRFVVPPAPTFRPPDRPQAPTNVPGTRPTFDVCRDAGNWSFESGYDCWTVLGEAFGRQPVQGGTIRADRVRTEMAYSAGGIGGDYWKDLGYPIGIQGEAWAGSYETHGDGETGRLVSQPFAATPYVSLLMGGGASPRAYVALEVRRRDLPSGGTDRPAVSSRLAEAVPAGPLGGGSAADLFVEVGRLTNAQNSEELQRRWFHVPSLTGVSEAALTTTPLQARIVIVDDATESWGHINVDDIRFESDSPAGRVLGVDRGGSRLFFDADHPVWGFADTHTHPAAHLGFGGKMIVGDPSLPLDQTFATSVCAENHGGIVVSIGPNKSYQNLATALADAHFREGAPDYIGYPRFNVKLHQGYHPEWFRRAFQGGERLVVALAVNNQYLATRALGEGIRPGVKTDDDSQMREQLAFIRREVDAHPDFMQVALTPRQAREIILSGRMAVVLGIESDNFGNFKDESYLWRDNPVNGTRPLVTLSSDLGVAKRQLAEAIQTYRDAGARQVTAIHYIDGLFGGVPVFRLEPLVITAGYTNHLPRIREGRDLGVASNILSQSADLKSFATATVLGAGDRTPEQLQAIAEEARRNNPGAENLVSVVSNQPMTDRGEQLMLGLMRAGMLVDSEHVSFLTKNRLFEIARQYGYPVMSSHTDVAALSLRPGLWPEMGTWPASGTAADSWGHLDDRGRWYKFFTSNAQFLASEFQALDSDIDAIHQSGGTVGIFAVPYRKTAYLGSWRVDARDGRLGRVRNNSDGSSKTWAQTFLYAAERMEGRGVALATDRAGIDAIGPRFGPYAAWAASLENWDLTKHEWRTGQRVKQAESNAGDNRVSLEGPDRRRGIIDKGVRYDRPIGSFHAWLYEGGDIDLTEEDAWKALGYLTAFPTADPWAPGYGALPDEQAGAIDRPHKVPASSESGHWGRIEAFVRGWHAPSEAALLHPGVLTGDAPFEQAVFWLFRNHRGPCDLRTFSTDDSAVCDRERGNYIREGPIALLYDKLYPVFALWQAKDGDNEPLRRLVTGARSWDFNLDGMAHHGLLPDFLQDLRNVGVDARQMDALFRSAEDYIEMWEKAEAAAPRVPSP